MAWFMGRCMAWHARCMKTEWYAVVVFLEHRVGTGVRWEHGPWAHAWHGMACKVHENRVVCSSSRLGTESWNRVLKKVKYICTYV